jgi:hypothetical protein
LKPGAEAQESVVYDIIIFPGKRAKERRRSEEDGTIKDLPEFDVIVGQDLFVAIEDLEERVLYDYNEISRRWQEQRQVYPIAELKLAPHYDQIKQKPMLTFAQMSQQGLLDGSHKPGSVSAQQSLIFYKRLLEYDALLEEIAITHPALSFKELTSGEWLERIAHIFDSKANDEGKYHRKIIIGIYNKRKMFLSERGDNVQLYQGIWYDDTNAFLVGSPRGAFCAASVEYLCSLHHQPCPEWAHDSSYILDTPWWYTRRTDDPTIREYTRRTTPPPFARHNIFCSNRLYQNKYEMYEWIQEAIVKGITDVHEIQCYARQKEISLYGA